MEFNLDVAPDWAYSWCFYFVFLGIVGLVTGIGAIVYSKKLGFTMAAAYIGAALVQAATAFTMFWMCRSSLKPAHA